MTNAILRGKSYAGNPHVRFEEGEVASEKPRRGSLLYSKLMTVLATAVVALSDVAFALTSDTVFLQLDSKSSSFWHTAFSHSLAIPVDLPEGATAATLTVKGAQYEKTYEGLAQGDFALELPAATSQATENVYELTLAFDDAAQTTRTARIGLIQGTADDGAGTTRCVVSMAARKWKVTDGGHPVLPVPGGQVTLTVDGVEKNTGLGGDQGWFALDGLVGGTQTEVGLNVDGVDYLASLIGGPLGLFLVVQ